MRKNVVKLGRKLTHNMDLKYGLRRMTEDTPEYWMLDALLNDEQVELLLTMQQRVPVTVEKLAKKADITVDHCQELLDQLVKIGFVEYNRHNPQRELQYVMPVFVVGSCENLILNDEQLAEHPEIAEFFYQMGYQPLKLISGMVPPGGAGLGFHVIPVEKAIPNEKEALDIEHLSYWLDKYPDQYAIMECVCRRSMRVRGEGCGELEDEVCIAIGDYADYIVETNRGKRADRKQFDELLIRTEKNGYMHQITNGDGPHDIFAICNCHVGSCYALRCSQLFNAQNLSASAYRARVETQNCVACGKCVEVCPAGAARLGQKLCTQDGPVEYPKAPTTDTAVIWSKKHWNYNYRNDNQSNCYDTGTAPCKTACPAHIAIQGYIKMAAQGRYEEALKLIKMDNPFPAVCGNICNRRCESACTRGTLDDPLSIDEIKKFIAYQELDKEKRYVPEKVRHKGNEIDYTEKIAVIGGGPAGLSCAYFLAEMSYPVTVFDRNPAPGGMLTMGIPSFRLEKDVVEAEIDVLREMGVEFRCGVEVGKDITLDDLRKEGYQAFYLGIGAQGGRFAGVPGEDAEGVQTGVDFLRDVNSLSDVVLEGDTVVIGGGNVAIDVSRTARRCCDGAVYQVCLEQRTEMMAADEEIEEAVGENIDLRNGWGPKEVLSENGKVTGIVLKRCTRVFDEEHRFSPQYDEEDLLTIPCSNVLLSIGQSIQWGDLLKDVDVTLNRNNTIPVDPVTYQVGNTDLFAGGDAVTGPRFAIDAIAAGREGAISIHRYVHEGQSLTLARNPRDFKELDKTNILLDPNGFDYTPRQSVRRDPEKVLTKHDDRMVFSEEQVKTEASRCLSCGATHVDQNRCIGCGICTTRCNFDAIHLERVHPEFVNYINGDYSVPYTVVSGAKHMTKVAVKKTMKATSELVFKR